MRIDFILDISCLWSYLTWCNLQTAMGCFTFPFQIKPFFIDSSSFFPSCFINPAQRAKLLRTRIEPLLRQSEIDVCFDSLPDLFDLTLPCRLIRYAFRHQKGNEVLSDVFKSFFVLGQNICDETILADIARKHTLSTNFFNQSLPTIPPRLVGKELLRTVPCLIFDQKSMIFGTQSVNCLKNMISLAFCLQKEKNFE